MRVFANLFLILFLADGGFSLVDELVSLLTPLMPFSTFRNLLAFTVILFSVPLYFSLGIDCRLPKRVFLPLIAFVFWTVISSWIFPVLSEFSYYGLILAVMQVLLGMLPLRYFSRDGERCLTMPTEFLSGPYFSLKNTLSFAAISLPVVPLVVLMISLASVNAFVVDYTAGFMRLDPGGLKMTERVYRRDDRTIRLAAMVHVGASSYYQDLAGSLDPGRTIVLAEGVTDQGNLLKNRIDYSGVAGMLGLTSQDKMLFKGRHIDPELLEQLSERQAGKVERPAQPDILRADVDVSKFRPPTIRLLEEFGEQLKKSRSPVTALLDLNSWGENNITEEMYEIIMDDILHRRNLVVLGYLDRSLELYDTVVIPWGALHMREIESDILKRGFKLHQEKSRTSINFWDMI